jgi:biotin--protein ligase
MFDVTGSGVNVTNKDPTMCINDALSRVASVTRPDDFTVEEIIARSVTVLEELITDFQMKGHQVFLNEYYKHWLHR